MRRLGVHEAAGKKPAHTSVHVGNYWVEQAFEVRETPEQILGQG